MTDASHPFDQYSDFIDSIDQLEDLSGPPLPQIVAKELTTLDDICRDFIAASPLCIMASANPAGYVDLSPRGDPPGFVQCLSDGLLAIPDRPGNRRMDTFHNLLADPRIGLLFLIPGRGETLRVRGEARLCRDAPLLEAMAVNRRAPKLAMLVHVRTAFMHCPKCVMRSNLWQPDKWPDAQNLADMNQAMVKHAQIDMSPDDWFQQLQKKGEIDLY